MKQELISRVASILFVLLGFLPALLWREMTSAARNCRSMGLVVFGTEVACDNTGFMMMIVGWSVLICLIGGVWSFRLRRKGFSTWPQVIACCIAALPALALLFSRP